MDTQTVVILDFGSQYTQLIARRIREQDVFSVVLPCTAPLSEIQAYKPLGLILSGGPSSVYDSDAPAAAPAVLSLGGFASRMFFPWCCRARRRSARSKPTNLSD